METSDSREETEIADIKNDEKVQRALSETSKSVQKDSSGPLEKKLHC